MGWIGGLREREVLRMRNWVDGSVFNSDGEDWVKSRYERMGEIKIGFGYVFFELLCRYLSRDVVKVEV